MSAPQPRFRWSQRRRALALLLLGWLPTAGCGRSEQYLVAVDSDAVDLDGRAWNLLIIEAGARGDAGAAHTRSVVLAEPRWKTEVPSFGIVPPTPGTEVDITLRLQPSDGDSNPIALQATLPALGDDDRRLVFTLRTDRERPQGVDMTVRETDFEGRLRHQAELCEAGSDCDALRTALDDSVCVPEAAESAPETCVDPGAVWASPQARVGDARDKRLLVLSRAFSLRSLDVDAIDLEQLAQDGLVDPDAEALTHAAAAALCRRAGLALPSEAMLDRAAALGVADVTAAPSLWMRGPALRDSARLVFDPDPACELSRCDGTQALWGGDDDPELPGRETVVCAREVEP